MKAPHLDVLPLHDDEDDNGEAFLDESDIIHEVTMDSADLPDVDR